MKKVEDEMVMHVSDNTALMSNLLYNLDTQLDELERCQEMLSRISLMSPKEKIPTEIIDYAMDYSDICREALEGFTVSWGSGSDDGTGVLAAVKKILTGIKNVIVKIISTIVEAFKYLFDTQYRHRKQFLDINKNLLLLASCPDKVKRFEAIPCVCISQAEAVDVLDKSSRLVNLIRFVTVASDHRAIDDVLKSFSSAACIDVKNDVMIDRLATMTGKRYGSFKDAGWDLNGLQDCIDKHISTISGIETLKTTKDNFEKDIKKLNGQVEEAMHDNVTADSVAHLQKQTALKIRVTRIIGSAIQVLNNRSNGVTNILKAINAEATKVMKS